MEKLNVKSNVQSNVQSIIASNKYLIPENADIEYHH